MTRAINRNDADSRIHKSRNISVLVVGDWLVDEHWVVGRHRTSSSSRTGKSHARALHTGDCSVRSLCGAGQVATILYQATIDKVCPFQINGIGLWHPADKDILAQMLDPNFNLGRTPHRIACENLNASSSHPDPSVRLYSLSPTQAIVEVGTTRIIRIYQHQNDKTELEQRLDWELPLTDIDLRRLQKGTAKSLEVLQRSKTTIQHIFIKDLQKGVISKELINCLKQLFRNADWYISSKAWRPTWLNDLPSKRVKLLLVPQLAARRAIDSGEISSASWLTTGGVPTQDAIKVVDGLTTRFPAAKIIILPEGMRVLAREGDSCYVLPTEGAADTFPFTPMASVFYPTLGAYMIKSKLPFFEMLKKAISFTTTWESAEAKRTFTDQWKPSSEQVLSLDTIHGNELLQPWREFTWHTLAAEWTQAFSRHGVVAFRSGGKQKEEFQVWRAMSDIKGYVTCIASKRRHILSLLREGASLRKAKPEDRRQKSFFVVDVPGSGKSYLIDCLAASLGMPCLKFNIASLSKRDDVIGCFQNVLVAQGEKPSATFIVFFDEMNARLDNRYVYDVFLEPLEDGTYVYNGKTYHLRPCLWIFAATEAPVNAESRNSPSSKALDFESRLSHPIMYLSGDESRVGPESELERLRRVEQMYIGVATIRQVFPDVTKVSTRVLEAFRLIDPKQIGPRGIRRFVQSFQDVQYGRVVARNLPENWNTHVKLTDHDFEDWNEKQDSERLLVEIRSHGGD